MRSKSLVKLLAKTKSEHYLKSYAFGQDFYTRQPAVKKL